MAHQNGCLHMGASPYEYEWRSCALSLAGACGRTSSLLSIAPQDFGGVPSHPSNALTGPGSPGPFSAPPTPSRPCRGCAHCRACPARRGREEKAAGSHGAVHPVARVTAPPPGGSVRNLFFFFLRTGLRDRPKGPSAANHQPPTANRCQPSTTNPQRPTAANHHQPPPTTSCQPPTAHRQHMVCPQVFLGKLCNGTALFFHPLRTALPSTVSPWPPPPPIHPRRSPRRRRNEMSVMSCSSGSDGRAWDVHVWGAVGPACVRTRGHTVGADRVL